MKPHAFLLAFFSLSLLLLSGCGGPIESFTFKSPEGDRKIDISGKRETPAGPIIVTVTLTVPAGSKTFTFEHQAGSLTQENVKANWKSNVSCDITFTYDDGKTWLLETYLMDDKIHAIRNIAIDGKTIFD
jgi:hypothetical protein